MEILEFVEKVLPILLIIFVLVFASIAFLRVISLFLINQSYKKYLALKKVSKKILPAHRKRFIKEEEERMREKLDIPKANSQMKAEMREQKMRQENASSTYEIIESQDQKLANEELNESQIVDIVKPVGFWTSMILGQKLTYLVQSAQSLNKRGDKGFWAAMIEAKERSAGRQHSRGR